MNKRIINILEYDIQANLKGKLLFHDWLKTLLKADIERFLPSQKND